MTRAPAGCFGLAPPRLTRASLVEFFDYLFGGFDAAFEAQPITSRHLIGGSVYEIASDLPDYMGAVETGLAGRTINGGSSECRIIVTTSGKAGLPVTPKWAELFYAERDVEAVLSNSRYRVHHMLDIGFWQFFDRARGCGIQLMNSPAAYPPWDMGSPLRNFVHWHFAGRQSGLIHAGTLAVGGTGVLLAGPGGSGKSGTVLGGLMRGMQSVGDDYVLLQLGDNIRVQSVFTTMKQDPQGLARLGTSRPDAELNWQGKHHLRLSDESTGFSVDDIRARALLLPHITGKSLTRIRPASAKDAFLALAPSGVSQIPGDRNASFAICAEVSRRLTCHHLDLGVDPDEITKRLRNFIADGANG